jgi:hypothetical protein
MRVCIEVLRNDANVRDALERDGWRQRDVTASKVEMSHPEIRDEEAARTRLSQLGLLTSNKLRIHFQACR